MRARCLAKPQLGVCCTSLWPERPNNSPEEADDGATVGINHARRARYTAIEEVERVTVSAICTYKHIHICICTPAQGKVSSTTVFWKTPRLWKGMRHRTH